jgi:hypothetical protein
VHYLETGDGALSAELATALYAADVANDENDENSDDAMLPPPSVQILHLGHQYTVPAIMYVIQ